MDKLKISRPIVVEGKYDKIRLSNIVDGQILTTDGFGIYNSREKQALIRALAAPRGLIALTDSDGAGVQIRSRLSGIVPREQLIHVYIPQRPGKERRKNAPSKAGFLGVEGIDDDTLRALLAPYADGAEARAAGGITKADLMLWGLSGGASSGMRRDRIGARLGLPAGMTPTAFLGAVNVLCTPEEFEKIVESEQETACAD